jgi:hypothetical protein
VATRFFAPFVSTCSTLTGKGAVLGTAEALASHVEGATPAPLAASWAARPAHQALASHVEGAAPAPLAASCTQEWALVAASGEPASLFDI